MKKNLLTNWKTTLAGVATLFLALGQIGGALKDFSEGRLESAIQIVTSNYSAWATAFLGIGLLFARDYDKSSEANGIKNA